MEKRITVTVNREAGKVLMKIEDEARSLTMTMEKNFAVNLAAKILNAATDEN